MDPEDASANDGVMVALLPITSDWCQIDIPHLTLVYAGLVTDLKPTDYNELAKDAASLAMLANPIQVKVSGLTVFGDTEKVNVLKLQFTPELTAMRETLEDWDSSDFPFNPHCTVGPAEQPVSYIPSALAFDRIGVFWGTSSLTFWLRRGNSGPYC